MSRVVRPRQGALRRETVSGLFTAPNMQIRAANREQDLNRTGSFAPR